jgi:uncharacterized protein YecE (DUF72 family)
LLYAQTLNYASILVSFWAKCTPLKTEYFFGCSGFYYNHWRGLFYPENLPKIKWLQFYAEHFKTLEINNTFYRYPTEKLLKGWYQKTPRDFRFTLKANRAITHTRKFNNTEQLTENFYKLAHLLGDKLSCVLFQLPPSIHKNMDLLEKIASQVDPKVTNVVEFRHHSWWESEVTDFLAQKRLVFCSVSSSELPETLVKTAPDIYVRFHGKDGMYQGFYSEEQLKEWTEKIKRQNPQRVFCYFNNDINANAVKNCFMLKKFLENEKK